MNRSTTRKITRVGLYLRLSKQDKGQQAQKSKQGRAAESDSIDRQDRRLREYAAARPGWVIDPAHIYADDGRSGGSRRTNADRAVAALAAGRIDVLLSAKIDRFSRMGAFGDDAHALQKALHRPGALFVAVDQNLRSDGTQWDLVAPILFALGKAERDAIVARVLDAREDNLRQHRWTGMHVPTGYRVTGEEGAYTLEHDPEVAPVLVRVAEALVNGAGVREAGRMLDEAGVRPARSARWTPSSVKATFTSPALLGRVTLKDDFVRDESGLPMEVYPAILPLGLFDSLTAVFAARAAARPAHAQRERREPRLLAGIAVCGACGQAMHVRMGGKKYRVYVCKSRTTGTTCPAPVSASAPGIEAAVTEAFLAIVGHLAVTRPVVADDVAVRLDEARERLEHVQAALRVEEDADEEARLLKERRVLRDEVARLEYEATDEDRFVYVETGETTATRWEAMPTADRRDLLAAALDRVEVSKGKPGTPRFDPARMRMVWGRAGADWLAGQDTE